MSEKQNEQNKIENCGMIEITQPTKICQKSCKICQSQNIKKIHELKESGMEYKKIAMYMKEKFGELISPSSICRHFQNYNKQIKNMSAEIIQKDMVEAATLQSVHLVKVVELIDMSLEVIKQRMRIGSYITDVSDLEKLMNMRYKLLNGGDSDNDMVALFRKASEKFGYQESLFIGKT